MCCAGQSTGRDLAPPGMLVEKAYHLRYVSVFPAVAISAQPYATGAEHMLT